MPYLVADLADARIVAVGRDQRAGRGAADRLHDEGQHAFGRLPRGSSPPAGRHSGGRAPPSRSCRGRDRRSAPGSSASSCIIGRKGFGQRIVAGDGERPERRAVIGGKARNHLPALALPDGDRLLPGQLQRRFHRFRAARDEEHLVEALGHVARPAGGPAPRPARFRNAADRRRSPCPSAASWRRARCGWNGRY